MKVGQDIPLRNAIAEVTKLMVPWAMLPPWVFKYPNHECVFDANVLSLANPRLIPLFIGSNESNISSIDSKPYQKRRSPRTNQN
jgi:hypothetical protein